MDGDKTINVTGGGAYKFSDLISEKLGLKVIKVEEMSCICAGANFLLKKIADESFKYEKEETPHYVFQSSNPNDLYPYLLVSACKDCHNLLILKNPTKANSIKNHTHLMSRFEF